MVTALDTDGRNRFRCCRYATLLMFHSALPHPPEISAIHRNHLQSLGVTNSSDLPPLRQRHVLYKVSRFSCFFFENSNFQVQKNCGQKIHWDLWTPLGAVGSVFGKAKGRVGKTFQRFLLILAGFWAGGWVVDTPPPPEELRVGGFLQK